MGTWSNALDCGPSVVKEQQNVAFVPSLHMSGISPNLVLETHRKIPVVSKPTLPSHSLSDAFIEAI